MIRLDCSIRHLAGAAVFVAMTALAATDIQGQEPLASARAGDGATELVLTDSAILFRFTPEGVRRITDEASARSAEQGTRGGWAALTERSVRAGVAGMSMTFPLADVRDVTYDEGSLTLTFTSRPADAPADSDRGRFVYEAVDERAGRAFVEAFRRR